uniref:Uncharacterized protein n=1 Tax=viral metagenome TaxID=1070528 RepID=A0A6C0EQT1_9ZZZZ
MSDSLEDIPGSNIFEKILNDATAVEEKLLGPTYPYYNNIKTPREIGMSDEGSMRALGGDINGLIQYVEILVTGKSQASATGGPLGNKFFLKTGAKCMDTATNQQVDRYIYVDNVPSGNIPFISQGLGVNFSEFEGLIPGAMGNLNVLNPFAIMQSFLSGSTPPCQELTMQTIDINNNKSNQTHFVTLTDIKNMDPCIFQNGYNPAANTNCKQAFTTGVSKEAEPISLPDDPIDQLYFASLAGLGVYILYKFMEKSN